VNASELQWISSGRDERKDDGMRITSFEIEAFVEKEGLYWSLMRERTTERVKLP
jgi:hypothetical protein